ncbi:malonyl-ACP O-methyltransferase BioC [Pseudalkalibacillus decolorationis]|uniref:malonyl-ACP O-methyltransferase BioC n=1 Tax=Pseudalkalibacillus decolorationis TaxID=163879 RepID=UPI002147B2AF|nr:malonyl-ACP O-methyltransferase BioC [Pseudalkalibacillus decolorationis]
MIDKQLLRKRFSDHARTYDEYANVQKKMANQLIGSLPKSDKSIDILEIGCGSGYLTRILCEVFPHATITAIDLAPGMIEVAKERMGEKRVTYLCGDIEEMMLHKTYDIIISNATFQWLNNPKKVIGQLYTLLKSGGVFTFSTFGAKTFQELHTCYVQAKLKLQLQTSSAPGQAFYSKTELVGLCERALAVSKSTFPNEITGTQQFEREYFQNARAFFTSVQKIGASNSNKTNSIQRPSFFRELIKLYETNYRDENGIRATYDCLFLSIKKIGLLHNDGVDETVGVDIKT